MKLVSVVFLFYNLANVSAQWGLENMMWPTSGGINAHLGMAPQKDVPLPCSTGDLKFAYTWKYGQDTKIPLNKCCRGYLRQGDKCVSACSEPCKNGQCTGVDQCSCREGFERASQFRCTLICEGDCPNGTSCLEPNVCGCLTGFVWNDRVGRCEADLLAQCNARCTNGFCEEVVDDVDDKRSVRCRCNPGFLMAEEGDRCREEILVCMQLMRRGRVCLTRQMTFTKG